MKPKKKKQTEMKLWRNPKFNSKETLNETLNNTLNETLKKPYMKS